MKLQEAIRKYQNSILGKKSTKTVYTYKKSLEKFLNFAGDVEIGQITEDLINENFKKYLIVDNRLNEISAIYVLQHVRFLFEFLQAQNIQGLDPSKLTDKGLMNSLKPNTRQYEGDIITEDEARQLLDYWKNSTDRDNPRGIRNQLIMSILWDTGMTIGELEMLERDDVDWKNSKLILKYKDPRKQSKNRTSKISSDSMVLLKKYFNTRQDKCQSLIVAFNTWNPYIVLAWPLSSRGIQRVVHRPVKDLKINKKISPSVFRATRYTQLIRQGVSLTELNKLIGVSGSSRQYLKFTVEHRPSIPNGFISLKEAAKDLGITTSGLRLYLIKHQIPVKKIWHVNYFDKKLLLLERRKKLFIPLELEQSHLTKRTIMEKFKLTENVLKYWVRKLKPETRLYNGKLYIKNDFLESYKKTRNI